MLSYIKRGNLNGIISPNHTMWFDEITFNRFAENSGFEVVDEKPLTWIRPSESRFDLIYVLIKNTLHELGLFEKPLSRQHFYVLQQKD
jgi:hypothetical protein